MTFNKNAIVVVSQLQSVHVVDMTKLDMRGGPRAIVRPSMAMCMVSCPKNDPFNPFNILPQTVCLFEDNTVCVAIDDKASTDYASQFLCHNNNDIIEDSRLWCMSDQTRTAKLP